MGRSFENEEGLPWELWWNVVSRVLLGRVAQKQLAELEEALLAMPDKRLVDGLAKDGATCAVGVYVASKRAARDGKTLAQAIADMQDGLEDYDYASSTVSVADEEGMLGNLAWHLAWLNDEEFHNATPEQRYDLVVNFVQRALGREHAQVVAR